VIAPAKRISEVSEYYFSKKMQEVSFLEKKGNSIINMGIGSPDIFPPKNAVKHLKKSLPLSMAHQYQNYYGILEFRQAIANFYQKQYKVFLKPESEVLPLLGSKEGILHISMAFLNKGDKVLIPNPGYPTYSSVTKLLGAVPLYYDLDFSNNWQPDFEKLNKINLKDVKIMWINYPNMPTGADFCEKTISKIVQWAEKKNILLVNDNPYSFILNDNPRSILFFSKEKKNVLELNSLSKSFNMAGWRIGMLLGSKENIQLILRVKTNIDSGMFYAVQKGAIAALNSSNLWFKNLNKTYKKRRKLVEKIAILLGLEFDKNSVGLFLWAKLKNKKIAAADFVDKLLYEKGIFIAPGNIFGSNGEGYVRLSLCVKEKEMEKAIKRLSK